MKIRDWNKEVPYTLANGVKAALIAAILVFLFNSFYSSTISYWMVVAAAGGSSIGSLHRRLDDQK